MTPPTPADATKAYGPPGGWLVGAYAPPGGWLVCEDCGAVVYPDYHQRHAEHHQLVVEFRRPADD